MQNSSFIAYLYAIIRKAFQIWDETERWMKLVGVLALAILIVASGWVATIKLEVGVVMWSAYFLFLLMFAPYLLWKSDQKRIAALAADPVKALSIQWRVDKRKFGEIIITNNLAKQINDLEVELANYCTSGGEIIDNLFEYLKPMDGSGIPLSLNPGARKFFRFVSCPLSESRRTFVLFPESDSPRDIGGDEFGAKFHVSARDVFNGTIRFRIKPDDLEGMIIEPWKKDEPAVTTELAG